MNYARDMTAASFTRILLSESQVKKLIAHREPFLFVRHAVENKIGERITVVARQNDELNVPTSLHMLEGMGQTSALLIRQVCIVYTSIMNMPRVSHRI